MAFSRVNGPGWATNDKLTSTQANALDIDHTKAIDGAGGSAGTPYTPTTTIVVGGEGIDHVYLADTAALKAVDTTSVADGSVRWVKGLGRYVLDKSILPSFTEDLPMVVAPTTGTGRWYSADDAATLKYSRTFTASGSSSWKCPPNLTLALVEVVGGGGGGGAGQGSSSSSHDCVGGPGGGAGQRVLAVVAPVGNSSHDVIVGTGGAGGTGGTPGGGAGGDGVASSIQVHLGLLLASANGGAGVSADFTVSSTVILRLGGKRANAGVFSSPVLLASLTAWPVDQGDGGFATNNGSAGSKGGYGDTGLAGGSGAAAGTTSTNKGGSGGAGGAGGAADVGGNGGAGGNGTAGAAGSPQNGTAGTAATANSGAGGGGGGGAGAGGSGSATGANGGAGGSGYVVIRGYA